MKNMKKQRFIIPCLLFSLFMATPAFGSVIPENVTTAIKKTDEFVLKALEKNLIPGCAIAVVYKNQVLFMHGYGQRAAGRTEKIDLDTVFQLGSVSKPIASTLASVLEKKGFLNLEDPVSDYLPNFRLKGRLSDPNAFKVKNILSHTSGLPRNGFNHMIESFRSYAEIVKSLQTTPVIAGVGRRYDYHNAMFSLIGQITERATLLPFQDALRLNLLKPLNMHRTSATLEDFLSTQNRASPHTKTKNGKICACYPYSSSYYTVAPAGGINSSIRDMANFLKAQMGGFPEVVPNSALKRIQTGHIPTHNNISSDSAQIQGRNPYYGLGWRIVDFGDNKLVYHGGWLKGFTNFIAFLPEQQLGIVVLHNADSKFSSKTAMRFLSLALGYPETKVSANQDFSLKKIKKKVKKSKKIKAKK